MSEDAENVGFYDWPKEAADRSRTSPRQQPHTAGSHPDFAELYDRHLVDLPRDVQWLLNLWSSCSTLALRPAIVSVPVRFLPSFLATVSLTVPSPVPLAPAVMVIHDSLELAVHMQVPPVDTLMVPVPPATFIFTVSGEIEYAHGACVRMNV